MNNKEKFYKLVSGEDTTTIKQVHERKKNRAMLRESQEIAFKVLERLDKLGWTQKDLAEKLHVSPQQVNKVVKGTENLTLETQVKLQEVLDIPILATYYEKALEELLLTVRESIAYVIAEPTIPKYGSKGILKVQHTSYNPELNYPEAV